MPKEYHLNVELEYRHYNLSEDFPMIALLEGNFVFPVESTPEITFLHFHNCVEVGYCYNGDKVIIIEDETFDFKSGDVCMIPPYAMHMVKNRVFQPDGSQDKCEYFYMDFEGMLKCFYPHGIPKELFSYNFTGFQNIIKHSENVKVSQCVTSIFDELRYKKSGYQYAVKALLLTLLIELHRMLPKLSEIANSKYTQMPAISPAIEYINENYMNRIDIDKLAELCHMSLMNFNRRFKKLINDSPLKYINNIRLKKACELLYSTENTILSIALAAGFNSVSSFNRNFMELFQKSPSKWRNDKCAVQKKNLKYSTFHFKT